MSSGWSKVLAGAQLVAQAAAKQASNDLTKSSSRVASHAVDLGSKAGTTVLSSEQVQALQRTIETMIIRHYANAATGTASDQAPVYGQPSSSSPSNQTVGQPIDLKGYDWADEELKQINICALGPLRMNSALVNAGALATDAKLVIITSQAGSVEWRATQNKGEGGDYGHHMSRAACNIAGVLQAEELKKKGYTVILLHPGFNRTEMTKKYEHIWDIEGAVDPRMGAKRVIYETIKATLDDTGKFINCEDGLQIPW